MANRVAQSGASYEAVLIDKITENIDNIIKSLGKLEMAMESATKPAKELSDAMNTVAKTSVKVSRTDVAGPFAGAIQTLTRARTLALSAGQGISQVLNTVASSARAAGTALLGAATAAGGLLVVALSKASSALEQQNRFNIAFGEGADMANMWAAAVARAFGRSETQVKTFASTFQTMLTGFGFADDFAGRLSQTLTRLSFDMASFNEAADEDVMRRLLSAMTGSTEAVERFGVNLKASALDAFLLSKGIDATTRDLDEQQKVLTRYLLVLESTSKAQNDVVRTSQSWANLTKALTASISSLLVQLGKLASRELLRPLQLLVTAMRAVADQVANLDAQKIRAFIGAIATAAAAGAGLLVLATAMTALAGAVIAVSTAISGVLAFFSLLASAPLSAAAAAIVAISSGLFSIGAARGFIKQIVEELSSLEMTVNRVYDTLVGGVRAVLASLSAGEVEKAWGIFRLTARVAFLEAAVFLQASISKAIKEGAREGFNALADRAQALNRAFFGVPARERQREPGAGGSLREDLVAARQSLQEMTADIDTQPVTQSLTQIANQFAQETSQSYEEVNQKLLDMLNNSTEKEKAEREKIIDAAKSWAQQFEKPIETFRRKVSEAFNNAFVLGSQELLNRAIEAARTEYIQATQPTRAPEAARSISGASLQIAAAGIAANLGKFGPTFDPLLRETTKQTKLQEMQEKHAKETNKKLDQIIRKDWVF